MSIVITGSVAYDYLMGFPGKFREHIIADKLESISLSFLVESMKRQRGGVGGNIAYTMKLVGSEPTLFATVGQDFGDYGAWLRSHGISTDHVIEIQDDFTASFFVNTDAEQNQIASFYTGAMAHARNYSLSDRGLTGADLVIVSPNDPIAMVNYCQECRDLEIPYAYDPSQQVAFMGGAELTKSIPGATYLLGNEYEMAVIEKKTGWHQEDLRGRVENLIITLGKKGSIIYAGDEMIEIPAARVQNVIEPTGAGDAFRGGFFASLSMGLPWEVAGRVGSLCSAYCLEHLGPSTHSFTWAEFVGRYEENFGAEPQLERLRIRGVAV